MDAVRSLVLLTTAALSVAACDGPSRIDAPQATSDASSATPGNVAVAWKHGQIRLQVRDQCDPMSFNQAVGAGDCVATPTITHRVTFTEFLGQIQTQHNVHGWYNNPGFIEAGLDAFIDAKNTGGEVHTFTRVAKYGGGIVPLLNTLAGTPTPAPECTALPASEFLNPGQTDHEILPKKPGLYHYECCIHPWMKTDVLVGAH